MIFFALPRLTTIRLAAFAFSGLLFARSLRAEEATTAETLFDEGRAALAAGNYDVACQKFGQSDGLEPAVGTHLNLANCEERRGHVATAERLFKESLTQLTPGDPRSAVAKSRVDALGPRIPRLTIRTAGPMPVGTQLSIAGSSIDPEKVPMSLSLDPGSYTLRVAVPERRTMAYSVELRENQSSEFVIPPLDGEERPPRRLSAVGERAQDWSTLQWAGAGAVAGGAVTLGVGGYFLLGALSKKSDSAADCNGDVCGANGFERRASAVSRGNTATALGLLGTVLVGTGVTLWLVGRESGASQKTSSARRFSVEAAPMGLGGQLRGQF